jgi:hypothetical protein
LLAVSFDNMVMNESPWNKIFGYTNL